MASKIFYTKEGAVRFRRRKAKFTFSEMHIMLAEVKKHRQILVSGKRNHLNALRKRTWAKVTAAVNEIGQGQREVLEVVKKWSDIKCDTRRKMLRSSGSLGLDKDQDLTPTEKIVYQILQMDNSDPVKEELEEELCPLQDARLGGLDESAPLEDEDEDWDTSGNPPDVQLSPPHGATHSLNARSSQHLQDDPSIAAYLKSPPPPSSTSSFTAVFPEMPVTPQDPRGSMLQSAALSLQEQHSTNVLLETVSRSLELLAESVQQLAESQQSFVRQSLQMQRETVGVLQDFASNAMALMHDKLNGKPHL